MVDKKPAKTTTEGDLQSNKNAAPAGGRVIITGPKGGRYYLDSKGNKRYVKR